MALDTRAPVLVGAGQVTHHARGLDDGLEPAALMAEAVERAALDAGLAGPPAADSVRVVSLLSWRYRDPAHFVAERLGLSPRETALTTMGGNSPQMLVNITAAEVQRGELDVAILAGGEAWRTRMRARRAGTTLSWPKAPEGAEPCTIGQDLAMSTPEEQVRGIVLPVQVYPMFETALRAAARESVEDHQVKVSELWARFSGVAAANPYAWIREVRTAEAIRTPSPTNRMIGLPYPKAMNSHNDVDQAAALIMCSAERARALGVPEDRWVFVHAGADCAESTLSTRWSLAEAPAIRAGGRTVLELAGVDVDAIEIVDLYSCFPSAVQLGAASLGLTLGRQLTRTGGMSFAGGPWNSYSLHAIATVMADLRARPGSLGLVWANGGFVTKHSFGVYGTRPPERFRHGSPQAALDRGPRRRLAAPEEAAGSGVVEAYTVMHDRDGEPELAIAACLLPDGRRAWGTTREPSGVKELCEGEWVGRAVTLDATGTLQL